MSTSVTDVKHVDWYSPIDLGAIYVVESNNGVVKVGKSIDPIGRIKAHVSEMRHWNLDFNDYWHSEPLENYSDAEEHLISWAERNGSLLAGNEYFTNLSFWKTVREAKRIVNNLRQ